MRTWGPESNRHSAGKLSSHEASGLWAACGPCLASGAPFASPVHSLAASLAPEAGGCLGPSDGQQASAPGMGPAYWFAVFCFCPCACGCDTGQAAWSPGSPPAVTHWQLI